MIEIAILYVLNKYDATIYRLGKIIEEYFFAYLKTSTGTLNPALKRLSDLGCVEFIEKMSDGGMLSKTYQITKTGKQHLVDLLLSFESKNPFHVINDVKIALCASDVLSINELIEFKENILNNLQLYKIKLENGLKNEYININDMQKKTAEITIEEIDKLIKLI